MAIDVKETIYYRLAEGTPFEKFVPPLKAETDIAKQYDVVFALLFSHHQTIEHQTSGAVHNNPLATVIQAIWLTWSFASHDVTSLRKRINAQDAALESMRRDLEELRAKIFAAQETVVNAPVVSADDPDHEGKTI